MHTCVDFVMCVYVCIDIVAFVSSFVVVCDWGGHGRLDDEHFCVVYAYMYAYMCIE
jgi:hypothetical protein